MSGKYRDVDSMLDHIEILSNNEQYEHFCMAMKLFVSAIRAIPYADVEEVKHCKDCIHWNSETKGCTRSPSVMPWLENDSCSYFDGGEYYFEDK